MIALCQLAERQGLLSGDLNGLQQRALQACMMAERKDTLEMERQRFKAMMISAHPQDVKKIEAAFSDDPDAELSGEEYEYNEEADPQTEEVLASLRGLGFSITDVD